MTESGDRPVLGLRERKKAHTRAEIQGHALRLFHEQGYDATTVAQIIEEAGVSESTFFRYFPAKADVVLFDGMDVLIVEAFRNQPHEIGEIHALQVALQTVFGLLIGSRSCGPARAHGSHLLGSRAASDPARPIRLDHGAPSPSPRRTDRAPIRATWRCERSPVP